MDSLRTFLSGIVDYAGLFPPAQLGMQEAVENYASYLTGPDSDKLGSFVVPVSRLDEFEAAAEPFFKDAGPKSGWRISALVGDDVEADMQRLGKLNCKLYPRLNRSIADSIELKASSEERIKEAMKYIPNVFTAYFESPSRLVPVIKSAGARGKIRTGGITQDAFPAASDIVDFIAACHEHGVPFKATAGLHHPIRGQYRLTYEPGAIKGIMYGYLNVFLAASMMRNGMSRDDAVLLLQETDAGSIRFTDEGVTWRGHSLTVDQIADARKNFILSFGSCSFREPVDEIAK